MWYFAFTLWGYSFDQIANFVETIVKFGGGAAAIGAVGWAILRFVCRPITKRYYAVKQYLNKVFVEDRSKLDYVHAQLSKNSGSSLFDKVVLMDNKINGIEASVNKIEKRQQIVGNLSNRAEFECGPDGALTYVNRACTRLYGVTERELLHFEWVNLIYPDDASDVMELVNRAIRNKTDFKSQHRIVDSSGKVKEVAIEALAIRDKNDVVVNYVGVMNLVPRAKREV